MEKILYNVIEVINMSKSLQELMADYNTVVANVDDLEKSLATLIGTQDWETTVISNTRAGVKLLYAELKSQRKVREEMEAQVYDAPAPAGTTPSGTSGTTTPTDTSGTTGA